MTQSIDLRSDTVTKPTDGMREAIASAEVGDDMWGEDPTVNELERRMAELLGKEAALFACSGTQSNQLGVWAHCRAGDELLIHQDGHIANYEGGAPAVLHGVTCRTFGGEGGMFEVADVESVLHPVDQHFPMSRLVCFENTTNKGGGRVWPLDQFLNVSQWAQQRGYKTHLDGARFFNACVAGGYEPAELVPHVDTISICFSKGLGCPFGSMLIGSQTDIDTARRGRKILGGSLRQAGIGAAAAIYALDHHIDQLAEDHRHARILAEQISDIDGLKIDLEAVESNLVFFDVEESAGTAEQLVMALLSRGVKVLALGNQRIRACTHLDISEHQIQDSAKAVKEAMLAGLANVKMQESHPYAYR
ncbi:beta-eliminating lyase-related protein [Planctomycetaceae bacterium]|jgi:threonine aldolase|nr:beta-eliminating lyase-related protein [Planctomycetaceae bacterium]MDC0273709.1 beta-eliminating lyase-related protein [Planctomycetaceae bacterium]